MKTNRPSPERRQCIDSARAHLANEARLRSELGGLCRPPNYAEWVRYGASLSRWHRRSRARQPRSIRHSFGRSERLQKGEQAVVRLEAGSLAALVRLELRQGSFL